MQVHKGDVQNCGGADEQMRNDSTAGFLDRREVLHSRKWYWIGRRAQDIVLSAIAIVVLAIPMLLIALMIWIDSPGAAPFFVQERVGRHGKRFRFYKFRTMVPDAEARLSGLMQYNEMTGPVFKMKKDPRITRVGGFLRRSGIDELPQLFNIIRGDMSIVGPRPALPRETDQYNEYQRQRLMVTPGLTCYWQVQPSRNDMSFEEWLELDLKYIRERSFWVDWKIIFLTVRAVLNGEGE